MEYKTIAGNYYTITSKTGCTVTDSTGTLEETVEAGKQLTVQAPSDKLIYDDAQAIVFKSNFSFALARQSAGGGATSELPPGYTRLEYIESTGAQYITTDYYKSTSSGLEISADCEIMGGDSYPCACALVPTDNGYPWAFGLYTNGCAIFSPFSERSLKQSSIQVLNKRCLFKLKANSLLIDGVADTLAQYGMWSASLVWNTARPLTLFTVPLPDKGWTLSRVSMKAFRFTASVSGEIERDFIPALDPTGTPCMFDLVSKQAFRNGGSGQFTAGVAGVGVLANILLALPYKEEVGSKLHVRLPDGANMSEAQRIADLAGELKNWQITFA